MSDTLTTTSIFILGCLHAIEPGHGKTFLLAYTVGGKLDFNKILLLTFSLLVSHFMVLSMFSLVFNILLSEFKNESIYEFAHLIGPILGKALYKKNHNHSDDCGHQHGKIKKSTLDSPVAVGLLTGMLPCASSLAVVMMTGMNVSYMSIISFIFIYVLGIALVLFIVVITFNFTKNIFAQKLGYYSQRFNPEIVSGILIMLVGLVYLSYNWFGHSH